MTKEEILKNIGLTEGKLAELASKYKVKRMSVFGSYARGDQTPESDIDFLVEWSGRPDFDRLMGLYCDLEDETQSKIDLASPEKLHSYIKDSVIETAQEVYGG